tara:strand:- start:111957 stop:114710 length:2754 start_codon:yes stop_codon:yes gene_type:complete
MRKRTTVSWLAAGIALLLVVPLILVFSFPMIFVGALERGVKASTGYIIEIEALEADLIPLRVATREMRLGNPASGFDKPLLTVGSAEITADPAGWWRGAPGWWSATIEDALVLLGTGDDGSDLWQRAQQNASDEQGVNAAETQNSSQSIAMGFNVVRLANIELRRLERDAIYTTDLSHVSVRKYSDERIELQLNGELQGQPLEASGTVALPSSERAQAVDFEAQIPGGKVIMQGTVGHDGLVPGKADFSIELTDQSVLSKLTGQDYTHLQPVILSGSLAAPESGRWELKADGEVADLPLQLAGALATEDAGVRLHELHAGFGESAVYGNGYVNTQGKRVEVELNSPLLNIDQLRSLAGSRSKTPQQQGSSQNLLVELASWQADITVAADEIRLKPYTSEGVSANVTADGDAVVKLEGAVERIVSHEETDGPQPEHADTPSDSSGRSAEPAQAVWQLTQPLQFSAALPLLQSGRQNSKAALELTSSGFLLTAEAVMSLADPMPASGELRVQLDSLAALEATALDKESWRTFIPLQITVKARPETGSLHLDPIQIQSEEDSVTGQMVLHTEGRVPRITGKLQTELLDINRFKTTPVAKSDEGVEAASSEEPDDLISDSPLDWSWLNVVELDLEVLLSELRFNQTSLRNVRLEVEQDDRGFSIDPLRADLAVGGIRGSFRIENSGPAPHIDAQLIVTQLTPADLGRKNAGLIDGGATDVLLNLATHGVSPQDLADHLDGEVAVEIQRAEIRNNLFEIIGSDLLVETVSLINPFVRRDDKTELECAAAYFKAKEGVLVSPDQLVVETGKIKIRGGGEIDLRQEQLEIDFVPRARTGLGVSLSGLASVVRIGGSLANPQPVADPKGLLKAGASIGAAISTGGLSLLAEGLFDRAVAAGGTACGKIFEKVPDTDIPDALEVDE